MSYPKELFKLIIDYVSEHYLIDIIRMGDIDCDKDNYNKLSLVQLLLSNHNLDIDVNIKDAKYGRTALIYAINNTRNYEICKLLLDHKDIDLNKYGITALIWAVRIENLEICKLLVDHIEI